MSINKSTLVCPRRSFSYVKPRKNQINQKRLTRKERNGNIIFGKQYNPNNSNSRAPHPTLVGGKDPVVQCAGMINFKRGRIVWYDNNSGHFRANEKLLGYVDKAMQKLCQETRLYSAKTIMEEVLDE